MDIDILTRLINENKIDKIMDIIRELSSNELDSIKKYLLKKIKNTNNGNERNTIAYLLGEMKCQEAVHILIELIFNKELINNRGTLIFALSKLECKQYIYHLLPLLYEGNYEVVMNTYMLLEEHVPKLDFVEQKECVSFIKKKINHYEDILNTLYDVYENIFEQKLDT